MALMASASLVRQLGALFDGGSVAGLSDRQLIERFAAGRDEGGEAAFAALVARHGPMVLGVCRQLLGDPHLAEDAFQAVFLVLARKARSLREPELLANWLYGVALRTARKARTGRARRRRAEGCGVDPSPDSRRIPAADEALLDRERAEALHVEIDRLPGAFRTPVVLCYFEGLTLDEAAQRLRWPVGTLRSRLARARDKLRRGLTRRGVVLPGAALTAALAPRSASASVSSLLCDSTTRAAIAFAARHAAGGAVSAPAAALAREVIRSMIVSNLKTATAVLLTLSMIAAGASWAARSPATGDPPRSGSSPAARRATAAAIPDGTARGRMTVVGRVLDPQGRPIAGARLAALADREKQVGDRDGRHRNILLGTAAVDTQGRFTLELPAIPAGRLAHLAVIAAAPGRGLKIVDLKPDAERQEAAIALAPEEPIEGRLVDVQGQPAAGIVVRVAILRQGHELRPYESSGGPNLWPSPATTDANGRFRLLGLAADIPATFEVGDPRFAHEAFSFHDEIRGGEKVRPGSTITLRPAQAIEFHVIHADDGRPAVGAIVDAQAMEGAMSHMPTDRIVRIPTDAQGRAQVVGWAAAAYRIHAYPAEGDPYLPVEREIEWPKAAVRHTVELKLRRGVVVRARVIEDPAGTPVAGAWVEYSQTHRDNPRYLYLPHIEAVSGPDGTFTMVVPHGPGHLLAQGPTADYLHVETSSGVMGTGIRPSFHQYPDAHARLDFPDGEATHTLEVRLRRGVTIAGRVIGPDGKPVAEAFAFGRGYVPYREHAFPLTGFNGDPPLIAVKDGRFEIPGCDPERPNTFYFLDVKDRLGATVKLSARSAADGPITVRLDPSASARFIMKGPDGKPVGDRELGGWPLELTLVVTPGPDFGELNKNFDLTPGDFVYQVNLDRMGDRSPRSGPDGRITMINLIPGAPYRFRGREFIPGPGETIDLDEIRVEKPGE